MMAALGVLQVREQFYRLDKRGAGFLSVEDYRSMLSVKQGGARRRWQQTAFQAVREQRVLTALRAVVPVVSQNLRDSQAQAAAHQQHAMV